MIGMVVLIMASVLLGLSHVVHGTDEDEDLTPAYIPVLISLGAALLFGLKFVLTKYTVIRYKYDAMAFAIGHPALEAFICSIAGMVYIALHPVPHDILWKSFGAGLIGGGIGVTLTSYGITVGVAGPVAAIA